MAYKVPTNKYFLIHPFKLKLMNDTDLLSSYDYDLPEELIATVPLAQRTDSRMLVLRADNQMPEHLHFADLKNFLRPGDCLVFNNTKVFPARLIGKKMSGGQAELLLSKQLSERVWEALVSFKGRNKIGTILSFTSADGTYELCATIKSLGSEALTYLVEFDQAVEAILPFLGQIPLPPYFNREATAADTDRYQTVYADDKFKKAVAAPTAGLHFSASFIEELRAFGIHIVFCTLHVGLGTFMPVRCENVNDHVMHTEEWLLDEEAAQTLNMVKENGGRICAVGTTAVRTLESNFEQCFSAKNGVTNIFIKPGYSFKAIDVLLTNFHLPKSTLLMLVSALSGRERILAAYAEAIEQKYRFYSYGDCCLLEVNK